MRASLGVIDIVAKTEDVFMKFIRILKRGFYGYALAFSLKINNIADGFGVFIQCMDKSPNALRLMERQLLWCLAPLIFIINRKIRI